MSLSAGRGPTGIYHLYKITGNTVLYINFNCLTEYREIKNIFNVDPKQLCITYQIYVSNISFTNRMID